MTETCPHCQATVLSTSQPERATPERVALEEAVRLFEGYGLIAGRTEADPLAAGRWINNARAALAATPADEQFNAVLDSYADENQRLSDQLREKCAELASCNQHLDAAYEAAGLSKASSKPLAYHIMELLAATPAVGGEPIAWVATHPDKGMNFGTVAETQRGAASLLMRTGVAGNHGWSVQPLYAAPPASPLRGITDEMLNAHLKATAEWVDPYEAATECDVPIECGITQDDADELNAQSRASLRVGYVAAFTSPPEQPAAQDQDSTTLMPSRTET